MRASPTPPSPPAQGGEAQPDLGGTDLISLSLPRFLGERDGVRGKNQVLSLLSQQCHLWHSHAKGRTVPRREPREGLNPLPYRCLRGI
jgi:hypothetical protein